MPPLIGLLHLTALLLGGGIYGFCNGHPIVGSLLLGPGLLLGLLLARVLCGPPVQYPYAPEECPEKGKLPEYKKDRGYGYRRGWSVDDDPRTFVSCGSCGFIPGHIYEMNASAVRANHAEREVFPPHP